MIKTRFLFSLLFVLSFASIILSLDLGSITLSLRQLSALLLGHGSLLQQQIMFGLRMPRTLSAFATGGLLALSGCLMQIMLRNPLADPYILGISGGAAVANLTLLLLGLSGYWLTGGAFIGAILSTFLVLLLAHGRGSWSPIRLLLTGVICAAFWAALISMILIISPNRLLHGMLFWLLGDLSYSQTPGLGLLVLLFGFLISIGYARELNLLAHGEQHAKSLGINSKRLQLKLYLLSSLLTATAVSLAGTIGFLGLIVPHIVRMLSKSDHRIVIPASILLGGSLLTLADSLARVLLAPQQLPVGMITTLIGVPIFLYLLGRGMQSWQY